MAKRHRPVTVTKPPEAPATVITHQQHWTGPLPPPGALAQFNTIIPDGAQRIMAMVEQEQAHRIDHENTILRATIADTKRGQWIGGAISAGAIFGAVVAVVLGAHPSVSVALVGLPIAAIVQSFISRK